MFNAWKLYHALTVELKSCILIFWILVFCSNLANFRGNSSKHLSRTPKFYEAYFGAVINVSIECTLMQFLYPSVHSNGRMWYPFQPFQTILISREDWWWNGKIVLQSSARFHSSSNIWCLQEGNLKKNFQWSLWLIFCQIPPVSTLSIYLSFL